MANTRDVIGDQATIDGLVSDTLTSLEESAVTTMRSYALYRRTALQSVRFPNLKTIPSNAFLGSGLLEISASDFPLATSIGDYCFADCSSLIRAEFPSVRTINDLAFQNCSSLESIKFMVSSTAITKVGSGAFKYCRKLRHVLLNGTAKVSISNAASSVFSGTPLVPKEGALYVPANLLSAYKADANLEGFIIVDMAEYPLSSFETISDTWQQISINANYATDYHVGDTKKVTINNADYMAEIVGFNKDVKADGTGNAHITWLMTRMLSDTLLNPSNQGTWEDCLLRTTTFPTVLNTMSNKDYIVPVTKTFYDYDNATTKSVTDSIWIPSRREMFGESASNCESSGCDYTDVISSATKRVCYNTSYAPDGYFLRSRINTTGRYGCITNTGSISNAYPSASNFGVRIGFCT